MKKKLTLAIDEEIIGYVDKQIKERLFGSRSHAFEYLVAEHKKQTKVSDTKTM